MNRYLSLEEVERLLIMVHKKKQPCNGLTNYTFCRLHVISCDFIQQHQKKKGRLSRLPFLLTSQPAKRWHRPCPNRTGECCGYRQADRASRLYARQNADPAGPPAVSHWPSYAPSAHCPGAPPHRREPKSWTHCALLAVTTPHLADAPGRCQRTDSCPRLP